MYLVVLKYLLLHVRRWKDMQSVSRILELSYLSITFKSVHLLSWNLCIFYRCHHSQHLKKHSVALSEFFRLWLLIIFLCIKSFSWLETENEHAGRNNFKGILVIGRLTEGGKKQILEPWGSTHFLKVKNNTWEPPRSRQAKSIRKPEVSTWNSNRRLHWLLQNESGIEYITCHKALIMLCTADISPALQTLSFSISFSLVKISVLSFHMFFTQHTTPLCLLNKRIEVSVSCEFYGQFNDGVVMWKWCRSCNLFARLHWKFDSS